MNSRWVVAVVVLIALPLARCGCGGSRARIDVDAVNALVPAELRDQLVFEVRTLAADDAMFGRVRYTVAAPRDWLASWKGFAMLRHPDERGHRFTQFHLGYNCDGVCEPKDWNAVIDHVYAYYLRGRVIENVKGATSRLLIAQAPAGATTVVLVAHWKAGASRYEACDATLEHGLQAAARAFEKACEVVDVR